MFSNTWVIKVLVHFQFLISTTLHEHCLIYCIVKRLEHVNCMQERVNIHTVHLWCIELIYIFVIVKMNFKTIIWCVFLRFLDVFLQLLRVIYGLPSVLTISNIFLELMDSITLPVVPVSNYVSASCVALSNRKKTIEGVYRRFWIFSYVNDKGTHHVLDDRWLHAISTIPSIHYCTPSLATSLVFIHFLRS